MNNRNRLSVFLNFAAPSLLGLSCPLVYSMTPSQLKLSNQKVEASFSFDQTSLSLSNFSKINGPNLLTEDQQKIFVLENKEGKVIYSGQQGWTSLNIKVDSNTSMTSTWSSESESDIVQISFDLREQFLEITVEKMTCAECVWTKSQFPHLTVKADESSLLHTPRLSGALESYPPISTHKVWTFDYPSFWTPYQLFGLFKSNPNFSSDSPQDGTYLAHHDPEGAKKFIVLDKLPGAHGFVFKTYWQSLRIPSGKFVIGAVNGPWQEHAKFYRQWTLGKEPIWNKAKRNQNTFQDIDQWIVAACSPQDCLVKLKKIRPLLEGKVGFHWYDWHVTPFDTDYPQFFPEKEGFREVVKELQKMDYLVMPYINGQIWDNNVQAEHPEGFENSVFNVNLKPSSFEINNRPFSSGCPTTLWWQTVVKKLVVRLVKDFGVDGVYFDSVAAGYGTCFAQHHNHLPGWGGDYFTRGYYKILSELEEELGTRPFFTTEGVAEPYVGRFDGFLSWNFGINAGSIPAYQFIFASSGQAFGRFHDNRPLATAGGIKALRIKLGQALVAGEALGWIYPYQMTESEWGLLRKFAQFRNQNKKYFFGEPINPPKIITQLTQVEANWWTMFHDNNVKSDAIQIGSFKAEDGSTRTFFVNTDDKTLKFEYIGGSRKSAPQSMEIESGEIKYVENF